MPNHIALLRGINVGGAKRIGMADLRVLLADLGYGEPRSLLQTGNLVFDAGDADPASIERRLEAEMAARLGLKTSVFVRTVHEWQAVLDANPFPNEARSDPGHLVLLALKQPPTDAAVTALRSVMAGPEMLRTGERCAYIVYPNGIGRSRLTPAQLERYLGPATGRNWNTAQKLGQLSRNQGV